MPRPKCCRNIALNPHGIAPGGSEPTAPIALELDELEAIRLADLEGLYHDAAAREMGVSRPTFGRILMAARRKVAQGLLEGRGVCLAPAGPSVRFSAQESCGRCGARHGQGCCGGGSGCGSGRGRRRRGWRPPE